MKLICQECLTLSNSGDRCKAEIGDRTCKGKLIANSKVGEEIITETICPYCKAKPEGIQIYQQRIRCMSCNAFSKMNLLKIPYSIAKLIK